MTQYIAQFRSGETILPSTVNSARPVAPRRYYATAIAIVIYTRLGCGVSSLDVSQTQGSDRDDKPQIVQSSDINKLLRLEVFPEHKSHNRSVAPTRLNTKHHTCIYPARPATSSCCSHSGTLADCLEYCRTSQVAGVCIRTTPSNESNKLTRSTYYMIPGRGPMTTLRSPQVSANL